VSLEKARAALADAVNGLDGVELDASGCVPLRELEKFTRLMQIANVQAQIAQAEALDDIALEMHRFNRDKKLRGVGAGPG
jgi:hypothetical protein